MIETYDVEVVVPPCDPGSARLVAKARLSVDIAPVLPYLNATLPEASYLPEVPALIWNDDGHSVAFHPHEIAVGEVEDRADAERLVADLVALVDRIWERRVDIVPSEVARPRPTPMAVYRLLPGTNCKECGLPGCWQFATHVVVGEAEPGGCPPLAQPDFAARLAELRKLVG